MKSRYIATGLIVGIICISVLCVMYDLREYEEIIQEEQYSSATINHTISGYRPLILNFSQYTSFPEYQFDRHKINEIIVEELIFSTAISRLVYVEGTSSGLLMGHFHGNFSVYKSFTLTNISVRYIFAVLLYFDGPSSTNVTIAFDLTINCTFWKPPKHTIAGTILSINPEVWIFVGSVAILLPVVAIARRLWRE